MTVIYITENMDINPSKLSISCQKLLSLCSFLDRYLEKIEKYRVKLQDCSIADLSFYELKKTYYINEYSNTLNQIVELTNNNKITNNLWRKINKKY